MKHRPAGKHWNPAPERSKRSGSEVFSEFTAEVRDYLMICVVCLPSALTLLLGFLCGVALWG